MSGAPEELRTDRLVGRRISAGDLADFQSFYGDPEVMRLLHPDGGTWSPDAAAALLEGHLRHWVEHGFGTWIFRDRETGAFAGRAGLRSVDLGEGPVVEIFYGVASGLWGRGLATEMARAVVGAAFELLRLPALVAFTLPANQASQRVLAKCGFVADGEIVHAGYRHLRFRREAVSPAPLGRPEPLRTKRPAKLSQSARSSRGTDDGPDA